MIGEESAILRRQSCACRDYSRVEFIELVCVGGRICCVRRSIRRIHLHENIPDERDVLDSEFRISPEMGIRLAAILGKREVIDVVGNGQHGRSEFTKSSRIGEVAIGKFLRRFLENKTVCKEHIGFGQRYGHVRRGFKRVGVGSFGNDSRDLRQSPGHIRNDRRNWGDSG